MCKIYFTKVTSDHWSPKNRLHKSIKEFARACERIAIKPQDLEKFTKYFLDGVEQVNKKHLNCIFVKPQVSVTENKDVRIVIPGVVIFVIYLGKEVSYE